MIVMIWSSWYHDDDMQIIYHKDGDHDYIMMVSWWSYMIMNISLLWFDIIMELMIWCCYHHDADDDIIYDDVISRENHDDVWKPWWWNLDNDIMMGKIMIASWW